MSVSSSALPSAPPHGLSALSSLVTGQSVSLIPSFTLESGITLRDVPVAWKTWGRLNEGRDNCMVLCHALTGSADVEDWWGPALGPGRVFDPTRYFIFCGNVLGSPYGSASPLTVDPTTGKPYGPRFPLTTIRDDVRIHKLVLDSLGVKSVAAAIGGSMGGMAVLEWPLCTPPGYVRHTVPIATSAAHSAWCIAWGETQRHSIFNDPLFQDGEYHADRPPRDGLAVARMMAMLMYRSHRSFHDRFGRRVGEIRRHASVSGPGGPRPSAARVNPIKVTMSPSSSPPAELSASPPLPSVLPMSDGRAFNAQSYLQYQGDKFNSRFDANCYIHLTYKLDTHDIGRPRAFLEPSFPNLPAGSTPISDSIPSALARLPPSLVIGVVSDGLFLPSEQVELADGIHDSQLEMLDSQDGHDGFLLQFEELNALISSWLKDRLPHIYQGVGNGTEISLANGKPKDFQVQKSSVFGEAEVGW